MGHEGKVHLDGTLEESIHAKCLFLTFLVDTTDGNLTHEVT